ncbi:Trypsin-like peptidase domain-containing protein [Thermomonospora echinospora]|uniref:Trypsin-like peptidase domain-containing protein n=1 Tax=Thermomonospora echinospora TaxID=1992 RepID=A0A1H6B076_9ACTN|nr:trypsin-like peptidase domain-containing protein [Thermomonospora echinospora]SEG53980.1 Trypsin-like peptidase domain-containing protein [Thermomonospora echinospora]
MTAMRWRARVDTVDGRTLGAGLLVTGSRILTCAHVVKGLTEVCVTFPGVAEKLPATVTTTGPWRSVGDPGDVAVLTLDDPVPLEPCEFASCDVLTPWAGGAAHELRALGFPHGHERDGIHVTVRTDAYRMLREEWLEINVAQAHLQLLDEGCSGAAVYFPDTGKVVGMITDAVLDDERGGVIGRMLPLSSIRRHWEGLDDLLPLDWLPPEPRRELRALVTGATSDRDLGSVFREAFPTFLRPPETFGSVWEAVRFVGETVPGQDRLRRFLVTLTPRLDQEARPRLADWLRRRLPSAEQSAGGRAPASSIIVRLDPLTRGAALELTVSTIVEGVGAVRSGPLRIRRDQVRTKVEHALAAQVRTVHDLDWMIEFVVPERLMNEPFEDWGIPEPEAERRRPRPLRSVPLVVRHVDRLKPLTVSRLTRGRWRTLRARGALRPQQISCRLDYDYEAFYDWLDAGEELCALIYAAPPRDDWLSAALDTGIPIMLWRRRPCADSRHAGCAPEGFLDELAAAVSHLDPDALPVEVMRLRKRARAPGGGDHHCGHRLTLFWDDPARRPDPPLAMGRL